MSMWHPRWPNVPHADKQHSEAVMPMPHPPVGGSPCSSAVQNFSSTYIASTSPPAFACEQQAPLVLAAILPAHVILTHMQRLQVSAKLRAAWPMQSAKLVLARRPRCITRSSDYACTSGCVWVETDDGRQTPQPQTGSHLSLLGKALALGDGIVELCVRVGQLTVVHKQFKALRQPRKRPVPAASSGRASCLCHSIGP